MNDDRDDKPATINQEGQRVEGDQANIGRLQANTVHFHNTPTPPVKSPDLLAEALAQLAEMPTDRVPDPGPLPPNSRMPYSVNPKFTGREADFKKLAETLKGAGHSIVVNQAITGLGGVGKTQLAAEFGHRYGRYFQGGVFWLSFADGAAVPAEIAACGRRMNLTGLDALSLADQV